MGSYRSRSIYQLHIQLEEIEPAIWRRISVPGKISLARLHRLLYPHRYDHERVRTWVGAHFDPELFSMQQLNSAFAVE